MTAADPPAAAMEELPPSECWRLLRTTPVGRLGLRAADDGVEIFPINYVVDHGSIVFRTGAGTKLDRIGASERVTFETDDSDLSAGVAWSVIAKGPCGSIEVHGEVLDSFDLEVFPWHAGGKPVYVRLVPEELTGRRFTIDPDSLAASS